MNEMPDSFSKPDRLFSLTEPARMMFDYVAMKFYQHLLMTLPKGDGHSVLIVPGFSASDDSTRPLREYLNSRNYETCGWQQGFNLGWRTDLLKGLKKIALQEYEKSGQKISLIGQSLGGVYARELAREIPEAVRHVITLGSPICDSSGEASSINTLYKALNPEDNLDPGEKNEHHKIKLIMSQPPPVPTTAVYSKYDGIVQWQACVQYGKHEMAENVEVNCSHCGMGFSPLIFYVLADRLSQPKDQWRPFTRRGLLKMLIPQPAVINHTESSHA